MTSTHDPRPTDDFPGPQEGDAGAGGLADLLAGLVGNSQPQGDIASALQNLVAPREGKEPDLQALLARLVQREPAEDETSTVALAAKTGAGTASLSPELLGALEKSAPGGQTSAVPDALKRAVEALGLPATLVEKILPAIMQRLPAATAASPDKPVSKSVRKRSESSSAAAKKPSSRRAKPAEASSSRKKSPSSDKPKSSGKSSRSGSSGGASKSTGKRSSGSSNSASKRRKKSESTADVPGADVPGLEDIIKGLLK